MFVEILCINLLFIPQHIFFEDYFLLEVPSLNILKKEEASAPYF